MAVNFINPHDIMFFDATGTMAQQRVDPLRVAPLKPAPNASIYNAQLDLSLPNSFHDDLTKKPSAHRGDQQLANVMYGPLPHDDEAAWQRLDDIVPEHYDTSGAAAEADYSFADEYVNALDEGRDHLCSGAEGRHVMEVLMAIFEAGAYRRQVDLPQADRRHPLMVWREAAGLGVPAEMPRPYHEWLEAEDRRLGV